MTTKKQQPAAIPAPDVEAFGKLRDALGAYNARAATRDTVDEMKLSEIGTLADRADTTARVHAHMRGDGGGRLEHAAAILPRVKAYVAFNRGVEPRQITVEGETVTLNVRYVEQTSGREAIKKLGDSILDQIDEVVRRIEQGIERHSQKLRTRSAAVDFWLAHPVARPFVEAVAVVVDFMETNAPLPGSTLDHATSAMTNVANTLRGRDGSIPSLSAHDCVNELRDRKKAEALAA